jgi:hypothetical protein
MDKDITMDKEEIRKNILIISLDNLSKELSDSLEEDELNPEERELAINMLSEIHGMLYEYSRESKPIERPSWNKT